MNKLWLGTIFPIAYLYLVRIMGVFLFIPILSVSMRHIQHATPFLVGIVIGLFGLVQAIFQIPFGIWSDRYGRKKLITLGFISYIIGSILGIISESIYTLILARSIQGFGAISAVLSALIVDLTPEQVRIKAFAFLGVMIAIVFMLCMLVSPILVQHFGLTILFYLVAVFSLIAMLINAYIIPNPNPDEARVPSINETSIKSILKDKKLSILNHGILFQHVIICSTFYVIPILLTQLMERGELPGVLYFYLPTLTLGFLLMTVLIAISEKYRKLKPVFLLCILTYSVVQFSLMIHPGMWGLVALFVLFFTAFNFLEAYLFTLVSKFCSASSRGTALGIFATYQFFGFFLGGVIAGMLAQSISLESVFVFNGLVSLVWFFHSLKLFKED